MTGRTLASIALKVWGVVFLVGALTSLPQVVFFLQLPSGADQSQAIVRAQQMLAVVGLGARALVGVLLIVFADGVARWSIPETGPLIIDADASDLTAVAFAVAGAFVLVWGLEDLASIVSTLVTKPEWLSMVSRPSYVWSERRVEILRAITEIGAAAVLILGRAGLARAWSRLRGRSSSADAEDME